MVQNIKTEIRTDYNNVFSTDEGKRVLSNLYKFCGVDKQIRVPGDPDATLHNASLHAVAQHIQGMLSQTVQQMFDLTKDSDLIRIKSRIGDK